MCWSGCMHWVLSAPHRTMLRAKSLLDAARVICVFLAYPSARQGGFLGVLSPTTCFAALSPCFTRDVPDRKLCRFPHQIDSSHKSDEARWMNKKGSTPLEDWRHRHHCNHLVQSLDYTIKSCLPGRQEWSDLVTKASTPQSPSASSCAEYASLYSCPRESEEGGHFKTGLLSFSVMPMLARLSALPFYLSTPSVV
jgi:hypothetical protein